MTYFSNFKKNPYTLNDIGTLEVTNIALYSKIFARVADDITFYSYYTFVNGDRLDTISQKLYGTPDYYWTIPLINPDIINTYRDLPKEYNEDLIKYLSGLYPGKALKLATNQSLAGKFNIGEVVTFGLYTGVIEQKFPTLGYLTVTVTSEDSFPTNQTFTLTGSTSGDTIQIANVLEGYAGPHHYLNEADEWVRWNATDMVTQVTILEYETTLNDIRSQIRIIKPESIYAVVNSFEREMRR
jgi:hypothetical protein